MMTRNALLIFLIAFFISHASYAQNTSELTTIILLRHAEKKDDGTRDPDLSAKGQARALQIKSKFAQSEINKIYSSPYRRTKQTVAPLADALGQDIIEYDPSSKDFIQSIYQANKGKTILVSGHSNTTPAAANSLIGKDQYQNMAHEEYGTIFIVTIDRHSNTKVLEIKY